MKLLVFLLLPCLSLSEVGKDFSKCKQFFLNGVPLQFAPSLRSTVKPICQCLKDDNGQQKYFYATLYNTAWRIPVYSAYVLRSPSPERKDYWYIEPQLDKADADPCMGPQGKTTGDHQALDRDYDKSGYNRGHLYPVQHTDNAFSMLATSTLTNAAPQNSSFNQGAWRVHEAAVITDLKDCEKAYVMTGVVPDLTKNINNRVAVSKYYWRATCCVKNNKFTGQGYYGPNNNYKVEPLSIAALQNKLSGDYKVNKVVIFPGVSKTGCN